MKLENVQNQLQLENSQAEENGETEAKVEEVFKSVTHLHEVNEDSSDESSSSNGLPLREMSVIHDLSVKSKGKQHPSLKEPDINTITVGTKKDGNKEATHEVIENELPPATEAPQLVNETNRIKNEETVTRKTSVSGECKINKPSATPATKLAEEQKSCIKKDNGTRKTGECMITKDTKDTVPPSVKAENTLSNGPTLVKEQLKPEETLNRPKLDEIFPTSVDGSKLDINCESTCARQTTEKAVAVEERMNSCSPVPAKKAKVEIIETTCKASSTPKAETTTPLITNSEVMKSSTPDPPSPLTSVKDPGEKPPAKKTLPAVTENNQVKTENKANNAVNPVVVQKEEKINEGAKAKCPNTASSSKSCSAAPTQEKKESKKRSLSKPRSSAAVGQKVPPKESMMAGGECFAPVDGIDQETRGSAAAVTTRRTSITHQRGRDSNVTTAGIAKHINKLRNNQHWKKKHLVIAGGLGIAMVCFYAYYKTKT
ncbi:unnamed protein product [Nezara viridula]|uniref:Uncharacterized protein n=1 Tax=Nezara viridula TaxID=85310 RepID=A0A9P0E0M9_NEZVI|nr:unnamed protein product [Nezara viridula]